MYGKLNFTLALKKKKNRVNVRPGCVLFICSSSVAGDWMATLRVRPVPSAQRRLPELHAALMIASRKAGASISR